MAGERCRHCGRPIEYVPVVGGWRHSGDWTAPCPSGGTRAEPGHARRVGFVAGIVATAVVVGWLAVALLSEPGWAG